jgi:glycoprotein-N-acetylgalactosamine 3-beta-galactosyltransferase
MRLVSQYRSGRHHRHRHDIDAASCGVDPPMTTRSAMRSTTRTTTGRCLITALCFVSIWSLNTFLVTTMHPSMRRQTTTNFDYVDNTILPYYWFPSATNNISSSSNADNNSMIVSSGNNQNNQTTDKMKKKEHQSDFPDGVFDVKYLRNHPLRFNEHPFPRRTTNVCKTPFGSNRSIETHLGFIGLSQVRVFDSETDYQINLHSRMISHNLTMTTTITNTIDEDDIDHKHHRQRQRYYVIPPHRRKRILCMIYGVSTRHQSHVRAIAETWGPRCDGFFVASNLTQPNIGTYNLTKIGDDSYGNIWMKVVAMWNYVYQNYMNDFDYFHLGGDDTFVIPENLRHMVTMQTWTSTKNRHFELLEDGTIGNPHLEDTPLLLGAPGENHLLNSMLYCLGGSGYTLNKKAVQVLVEQVLPNCQVNVTSSQEDVNLSYCMAAWAGVQCQDTRERTRGVKSPRYHIANAGFHARSTENTPTPLKPKILRLRWNISEPWGLDQFAVSSVSFHLKRMPEDPRKPLPRSKTYDYFKDDGMRRYYAIVYGGCPNNVATTVATPSLPMEGSQINDTAKQEPPHSQQKRKIRRGHRLLKR